jgi:hypothetical protein
MTGTALCARRYWSRTLASLLVVAAPGLSACREAGPGPVIVQTYRKDLKGIRAANPKVRLQVGRDSAKSNEDVLFVDYPSAGNDPAGRDVHLEAQHRNWSSATGIAFQIWSQRPVRLSVSFVDRNRVAYTTWVEADGSGWQPINLPFRDIRPNPYFQPPGAQVSAPIDVSDVNAISFAPQDTAAGRFALTRFVLIK